MTSARVTLKFNPDDQLKIVKEILEPYAAEASETIEFPIPGTATLVLPSEFVAAELADELAFSPLCEDVFVS